MPACASTTNRMRSDSSTATRACSWTRSSMSVPGSSSRPPVSTTVNVRPVHSDGAVDAVAGGARDVGDDRDALADEPVEERALADVRAADDGDDGEGGHAEECSARTPGRPAMLSFGVRHRFPFDSDRAVKIGIAATRLAGVDGVTFETAKWESRPGRDGPRAAPVRRRGRRAALPGSPGAADALHLAAGRAGDRRRLRSGERSGRGAQRDRPAGGPAGARSSTTGHLATSSTW